MPRPSKRKEAARKRERIFTDTASKWEETGSDGYSSGTESPNPMSEPESDCEDTEEWVSEQCRFYSLAYCLPSVNPVSWGKCEGNEPHSDIQQLKRKAGEVSSAPIEKKLRGEYSGKSRTTHWRRDKHAREHASDIKQYFKPVSRGKGVEGSGTHPV